MSGTSCGPVTLVALGLQVTATVRRPQSPHFGYEEAAKFVLADPHGTTILHSAEVNSGFFVLYARQFDVNRHAIILRADKLVTSALTGLVDERIRTRGEIYHLLRQFGVGSVVLEDRPTASPRLNWPREQTRSSVFAERFRASINSAAPLLAGASISVFERFDATPPDPHAIVNIAIPVANTDTAVPLRELIDGTTADERPADAIAVSGRASKPCSFGLGTSLRPVHAADA
jgi:hypothetical protein